jgi:hypothetical protein
MYYFDWKLLQLIIKAALSSGAGYPVNILGITVAPI